MRFRFQLEVGVAIRNSIRKDLEETKSNMEWSFPGSELVIRESKSFWESTFYIQGNNFPDTDECQRVIKGWFKKIENVATINLN